MMRTLISFLFILLVSNPALAHKISIYGYLEAGTVYTESYFASGDRCKNCTITATNNETGEVLVQGTANEEGLFDFPYQDTVPLKLAADAGSGHMGTYILEPQTDPTGEDVVKEAPDALELTSAYPSQIEVMLETKLDPIHRELSRLREASERPGLTEILGGIGYIIGLLGLWAYMRNRRERP